MEGSMSVGRAAGKIAVLGSGISGAVCASTLARNGISVTVFESARGPGGRMSQRRETTINGKELLFDHGAPFFTISSNADALRLVHEWESRGLVAEWKEKFGLFDCSTNKFIDAYQFSSYTDLGMKFVRKKQIKGLESRFGLGIGRLDWLEGEKLWRLIGQDGQNLGHFEGIVASDKNIVSSGFTSVFGRPPPLDVNLTPGLSIAQDIPVSPRFALMLAFAEPLSSIPVKAFTFMNSKILSWAHCDSSKPGRPTDSERWVLHSTMDYAGTIIAQTGLKKPSNELLKKVAEEMLREFRSTGLEIPQPFFHKAHRWGSAFPLTSVAKEEKCLRDKRKRLILCGDFCVSPNVEGAIISGVAAASKLMEIVMCDGIKNRSTLH